MEYDNPMINMTTGTMGSQQTSMGPLVLPYSQPPPSSFPTPSSFPSPFVPIAAQMDNTNQIPSMDPQQPFCKHTVQLADIIILCSLLVHSSFQQLSIPTPVPSSRQANYGPLPKLPSKSSHSLTHSFTPSPSQLPTSGVPLLILKWIHKLVRYSRSRPVYRQSLLMDMSTRPAVTDFALVD